MAVSAPAAAIAAHDPRQQLWLVSFNTYYDALFEETLADGLSNRWQRLDDFTKFVVSSTASGSAISGWALWGRAGWEYAWLAFSGLAALLSLFHAALHVSDRVKARTDDRRRFAQLRTGLETFRYRLQVEQFDAHKFQREFIDFRKSYSDNVGLLQNDTFRTRRFKI